MSLANAANSCAVRIDNVPHELPEGATQNSSPNQVRSSVETVRTPGVGFQPRYYPEWRGLPGAPFIEINRLQSYSSAT